METQSFSHLPDFVPYGYQVVDELGNNKSGGRVTYKAVQIETETIVVIKEFKFGAAGSNWTGFKAYEREIEILRSLNHAGIPRYLSAFDTDRGFCMVQEYKDAHNLAAYIQISPTRAKKVAVSVLEILDYLQGLNPPVFHRDIKPENILLDENYNVSLVDFGLARIGGSDMGASSVVVGTTGFMPPEQLLNRQLTSSSDLYSLGATLVTMIAGVESAQLADFVNENFMLDTKKLLPTSLEPSFRWWLEKMVARRVRERFPNAGAALIALQSGDIERIERFDAPENLKSGNPTREIAKTVASVTLAIGVGAGTLGGLGFGAYSLLQHLEQPQPQVYQIPAIPVKPKPKVLTPPRSFPFPDSKQKEKSDAPKLTIELINNLINLTIFLPLPVGLFRLYLAREIGEDISEAFKPELVLFIMTIALKLACSILLSPDLLTSTTDTITQTLSSNSK